MSLVAGVDSGGTKTIMALADRRGHIVSLRRAEGLDPTVDTNWKDNLWELFVSQATDIRQIDYAVLGLPYHGELVGCSGLQNLVAREIFQGNSLVLNDVRVAFDGAFAGKAGVLVLAGTGSMAWASQNGHGDPHFRVGGWGDAFGDEGSAFWIGRKALGIVSRDLDGRNTASELSDGVLSALGCKGEELMDWCYGLENRRYGIAGIAKIVSDLANGGCDDSIGVLREAGDHLAAHASAAWLQTNSSTPLSWSYAGGVFSSEIVQNQVAEILGCAPLPPRLPPIGGAILHAADRAGWAINAAWIDRLALSLTKALQISARTT